MFRFDATHLSFGWLLAVSAVRVPVWMFVMTKSQELDFSTPGVLGT